MAAGGYLAARALVPRVYAQDGLISIHNHAFTEDEAFLRAYARGLQALGRREDYQWHWRIHIGLWVARCAWSMPGDFVECGVNRGFLSSAIIDEQMAAMPPADVNGTWTGSLARGAATYTVVLKQTGTNVTGTLSGAGTADGPIEGVVEGNSIRVREESGYGSTPTLFVKGDQITGIVRGTTLTLQRVR